MNYYVGLKTSKEAGQQGSQGTKKQRMGERREGNMGGKEFTSL